MAGVVQVIQRSAGNRATTLLMRKPTVAGKKPAPIPPPAEKISYLLPKDRKVVEAETTAEILTAFSAFLDACQSNQTALKAAAKAEAEMFALVMDIVAGFAAPAFATLLDKPFLTRLKATVPASIDKDPSMMLGLIKHTDMLKASFTGVAKIASDQIKRNATALFGETDADLFLENLKNEFQAGAVRLAGKVPGMTDIELLAVWTAYDPELSNVSMYKASLKDLLGEFKRYVQPIDRWTESERDGYYDRQTRVYWIEAYGKRRLILVAGSDATTAAGTTKYRQFKAWVPPSWEQLAIKRTERMFGDVEKIEGSQIQGHIPAPN